MTAVDTLPAVDQRPCTACGLPILAEVAHEGHEDGCPNRTDPTHPVDCHCDQHTHPWCCATCAEPAGSHR